MRSVILERDNYRCTVCNSDKGLQVHHKTYKNIFNEKQSDLITLCRTCHNTHHNNMNNIARINIIIKIVIVLSIIYGVYSYSGLSGVLFG